MELQDPLARRRFARVKALVTDVDGVLTDGGMYYGPEGEIMKKFNTRDGMGIALLRKAGFKIAFITGEAVETARRRAEKLQIDDVYLGVEDKWAAMEDFLKKHGLTPEEVCYVGDDVNDLPVLQRVGVALTVADGMDAVKKIAHGITSRRGGEGAIREIADALLALRGR